MADHASNAPGKRGPSRAVVLAIVAAAIVAVLIVIAAIFNAIGPSGDPDSGNTAGVDAGGSPLPADSAGAPSVAGPTTDPSDPAAPIEASPVPLDSPAAVTDGLSVGISDITAIDGVASGVGEVGGPSLQFTVSATNSGTASVPLQTAVVGLTYGSNQTPSIELGSSSTPLPAEVAPGQTVTGSYVFVVPVEERGDIRITLDYRAGTPVAVFEGSAPN